MPTAHLSNRAILEVDGADTRSFLNGLITHDVLDLRSGQAVWAGLLTPQGKALFDFIVYGSNENKLLVEAEASRLPDLVRRLTMYKLRAAVTLTPRADLSVYAGWDDAAVEGAVRDPRLVEMGWRYIANSLEVNATVADYTRHRLLLGIPEGSADIGIDSLLWLETNADKLNGVSFTKGCYVGQENTARMFHRSKVRKRLLPVQLTADPGDDKVIMSGLHEAGKLHSHYEGAGLALMRLEYVDTELTLAGRSMTATQQKWLADA